MSASLDDQNVLAMVDIQSVLDQANGIAHELLSLASGTEILSSIGTLPQAMVLVADNINLENIDDDTAFYFLCEVKSLWYVITDDLISNHYQPCQETAIEGLRAMWRALTYRVHN